MPRSSHPTATRPAVVHHTVVRIIAMLVVGVVIGSIAGALTSLVLGLTLGWAAACIVYIAWSWIAITPMDAQQVSRHATREDPNRALFELLILASSIASLVVVVFLLGNARQATGAAAEYFPFIGLGSVALSWVLLHTLFTLRYARLYYGGTKVGGIIFNDDEPPRYSDFAYVSFTLGMTYQVSDTNLTSSAVRSTVLRHALLSYLFGAVILAATINIVAGFAN